MSAPNTNIEKQKRRHIGPLVGMGAVVVFGVGLIIYWQFEEAAGGQPPTSEDAVDLPVSSTPPDVIEPGPQVDPGVQQSPIAPAPLPQD